MSSCTCRRCGAKGAGDTSTMLCETCEEELREEHGDNCDLSDYD